MTQMTLFPLQAKSCTQSCKNLLFFPSFDGGFCRIFLQDFVQDFVPPLNKSIGWAGVTAATSDDSSGGDSGDSGGSDSSDSDSSGSDSSGSDS